jgi:SAM-dependent methyltransferase
VDDRRRTQATSFGTAADLYDRARPGYPPEAVEWALAAARPPATRIVDLGAGTGIMSRLLRALDYAVLAVEPDDQMRQRLAAATPDATALAGHAEAMPLPDAGVDAVVAAQSYHWFDHERAHAEIGRVVRPGGVFAAVWNLRDESVPWVAELTAILHAMPGKAADEHEATDFGPLFTAPELGLFGHTVTHTVDSLVNLLRSRSYYLTAAPAERKELEARVRDLAAHHPALRGRTEFPLRYVTRVYRAVRLG